MSAVDAAVAVAEAHGVHCEKLRRVERGVARTRAPVAGASGRARNQRRSRCRSGRRRTGTHCRPRTRLGRAHRSSSQATCLRLAHTATTDIRSFLWHYLAQAGKLDATAAGRGLHTIHESLANYDGDLPPQAAQKRCERCSSLSPRPTTSNYSANSPRCELPEGQALHGDAQPFQLHPNCCRADLARSGDGVPWAA